VTDMADPTLVEALERLRRDGYTADFRITSDGQLRCDQCTHIHDPTEVVIESTARFEGASNPDDQAVVFGVHCEGCGQRGAVVAAYGPTATAAEAAVITALASSPPSP